ncbi:MAG: bifunctional riboflavin kinase/FAD synthetase [Bacteroidota bacterium]
MQVIENLLEFQIPDYSVVTIGTFDGVHLGHQLILKKLVQEAQTKQGKSTLITFWPHPRLVLKPDEPLKLLSTFEEKVSRIKMLGVDYIVKLPFTAQFSNLTADEFVQKILVYGVGTKKLFIGYDHHFGNDREGNIEFLKKVQGAYGFEVSEISRHDIDSVGVSSTKIRNALSVGDLPLATSLLGRPYSIQGQVVHGQKKGRSIGFPTANLSIADTTKLLPGEGVYAVRVAWKEEMLDGMLNIGFRPTVGGSLKSIEVHLFDFKSELYGEELTIHFIQFLRTEKKFESLERLKNQLQKDKKHAINALR